MGGTESEKEALARFLDAAITHFGRGAEGGRERCRILDFGCGGGALVAALVRLGYEAEGCDFEEVLSVGGAEGTEGRLRPICRTPYRLPYPDESFDAVVSTSVLEHVRDKGAAFREIHRVLRPGGVALHLFPSKWYLPWEPHIRVPLANWFWPRVPRWWLRLWAWAGLRNPYQEGKDWEEVGEANERYLKTQVDYRCLCVYRRLSEKVFGNFSAPRHFFLSRHPGRIGYLYRSLPGKRWTAPLLCALRNEFVVQRRLR